MSFAMRLVTAPTVEPVSLEEAKAQCRIEPSEADDDEFLTDLIAAAREMVEKDSGRAFTRQTRELQLDAFPVGVIELPRAPLVSVSSVTYVDEAGASQVLSSALYQVDTRSEPGRVAPAYGTSWPATRDVLGAMRIQYLCGLDLTDAAVIVPSAAKHAMKLCIAEWNENRQRAVIGVSVTERETYDRLIDAVGRVYWLGATP